MNRKIIGSIVAILLAAIGTFVLLSYVKGAERRALAGEKVVSVLVVSEEVAKGTPAEDLENSFTLEQIPAKVRAEGAIESVADIEGRVAAVDLLVGEQVVEARFEDPAVLAQQGPVELPEGLQEVTVRLEPQRAVGGRLLPGDLVGIVASFDPFDVDGGISAEEGGPEGDLSKTPNSTKLIFHKVLVTNVQVGAPPAETEVPATGEEDGPQQTAAPQADLLITFAADTNAVEKIVFAQEFGTVWLTEEPQSADERPSQIETRGTIYE